MVIFGIFLKTKSDQNIHQNAPNCTILKNFIGEGGMPPNPPSFATCKFLNLKNKKFLPPPAKSWGRPCKI